MANTVLAHIIERMPPKHCRTCLRPYENSPLGYGRMVPQCRCHRNDRDEQETRAPICELEWRLEQEDVDNPNA